MLCKSKTCSKGYTVVSGIRCTTKDQNTRFEVYDVSTLLQVQIDMEFGLKLDIREMFIPPHEDPVCTRRGVRLVTDQVDDLTCVLDLIKPHWSTFDALDMPCFMRHLQYKNQEVLMNCPHCN